MNGPLYKESITDVLSRLNDLLEEVKNLQVVANKYNVNATSELPPKLPITILIRDELNKRFEELQNKLEEFSFDEQIKYFSQSTEVITKLEDELNHLNPAYPDPDFLVIDKKYQDIMNKIKSENPFYDKSKSQNTKTLKDVQSELIKLKAAINKREYEVDKLSYVGYESESNPGETADPRQRYLPRIEEALKQIDKLKRKGVEQASAIKPMTLQERAQLSREQKEIPQINKSQVNISIPKK